MPVTASQGVHGRFYTQVAFPVAVTLAELPGEIEVFSGNPWTSNSVSGFVGVYRMRHPCAQAPTESHPPSRGILLLADLRTELP
jgi:hypothetical protein